jgi:hypothetical protein
MLLCPAYPIRRGSAVILGHRPAAAQLRKRLNMPEKETLEAVEQDKREGKAPSTQAGVVPVSVVRPARKAVRTKGLRQRSLAAKEAAHRRTPLPRGRGQG